jgi:hypothetical protein
MTSAFENIKAGLMEAIEHADDKAPASDIKMTTLAPHSTVKVVDANGQISFGKQFSGRQVLVEEHELGVWTVRMATDTSTDSLMKKLSDGVE